MDHSTNIMNDAPLGKRIRQKLTSGDLSTIPTRRAIQVWLSFLAHANRDGTAYPSDDTVAAYWRVSAKTIRRGKHELIHLGHLIKTGQRKGDRGPIIYRIDLQPNRTLAVQPATEPTGHIQGAEGTRSDCQLDTVGPLTGHTGSPECIESKGKQHESTCAADAVLDDENPRSEPDVKSIQSTTTRTTLYLPVRCCLEQHGINPNLAESMLTPFASELTPAWIDRLMGKASWGPKVGGGAKLIYLVRELKADQIARVNAQVRREQHRENALITADNCAATVRRCVETQGLTEAINTWAHKLKSEERAQAGRRVLEYISEYTSHAVRKVIAERYPDPIATDWLAAIAFDDNVKQAGRTIIKALSTSNFNNSIETRPIIQDHTPPTHTWSRQDRIRRSS